MAIGCRKQTLRISFLFLGLSFLQTGKIQSQGTTYNYFYRIYFTNKGITDYNNIPLSELFSQRAILRRQKDGLSIPDYYDIPVYSGYLDVVSSYGFKLKCTSRWMNTGLFKTENEADISVLQNLPFVKEVRVVKRPAAKGINVNKFDSETLQNGLPSFDNPLTQLNGRIVHGSGYTGKGILIAVLDGGFYRADIVSSLANLRSRKGIVATHDFLSGGNNVYQYHWHGTAVMSVLAGFSFGNIEGSAPGAEFCLLVTEDVTSEFPVEEDYWAAGAEYADSIGADIISSSLGYCTFDDPSMNYKFSDMNGKTTFVTRAAEIAASKGIVVVTSAGNERTSSWLRIIAPTDGDSVLSAGAVDGYGIISQFSSAGPSADGRIKPDNVAQGVSVPVQVDATDFARANGTSFSCPLLSGLCACAMQAVPKATNMDIIKSLHENGDRAASPDSLYGFGLPDMVKVIENLQNKYISIPENEATLGPNPFTDRIEILFREPPGSLEVSVFSISGSEIMRRNYPDYISRTLEIDDLANSNQGLYFLRLRTSERTMLFKVIKIRK